MSKTMTLKAVWEREKKERRKNKHFATVTLMSASLWLLLLISFDVSIGKERLRLKWSNPFLALPLLRRWFGDAASSSSDLLNSRLTKLFEWFKLSLVLLLLMFLSCLLIRFWMLSGVGRAGDGFILLEASSAADGDSFRPLWPAILSFVGVFLSTISIDGISKLCLGNSKGKCGACDELGGKIPWRPANGGKPGGKNDGWLRSIKYGFGGVVIADGICCDCCCDWLLEWFPLDPVESQNRLCFDSDVTVLKLCPHLLHLICMRQSACIRLWRHRFENCVYALKQTSHWNGFTDEWMCVCCLRPDDVAKVFPHSGQAWLRAPTWCVLMCRCRFDGSVNSYQSEQRE